MSRRLQLIILTSLLLVPRLTAAQEANENQVVIGGSGEAYLKAIRLSRVDADVTYFDPESPPPPMHTRQRPRPPSNSSEWSLNGDMNFPVLLGSAVILMAIAFVFVRYGSGFAVIFGRRGANAVSSRSGSAPGAGLETPSRPGNLNAILQIRDRREALIELTQATLSAVTRANGVLLQRSWTARDALRHLPEDQNCLSALHHLVLTSERVHFGGREVSEEDFQAHVAGIRPLLTEVTE
ncbi:DUF4129 domain-containing protein [Ruegeria sp. ANG-R]|uniref:DUF4129 domain-containing protein n=1 Tax=Ruegeria sp. ANG-R TaxID=1577903 RepID=UPI001F4C7EF0|nr:DUF4129 domain-containing protein [Ruegeria sp. ANG-R]